MEEKLRRKNVKASRKLRISMIKRRTALKKIHPDPMVQAWP